MDNRYSIEKEKLSQSIEFEKGLAAHFSASADEKQRLYELAQAEHAEAEKYKRLYEEEKAKKRATGRTTEQTSQPAARQRKLLRRGYRVRGNTARLPAHNRPMPQREQDGRSRCTTQSRMPRYSYRTMAGNTPE